MPLLGAAAAVAGREEDEAEEGRRELWAEAMLLAGRLRLRLGFGEIGASGSRTGLALAVSSMLEAGVVIGGLGGVVAVLMMRKGEAGRESVVDGAGGAIG
jgi:hypothetical protein